MYRLSTLQTSTLTTWARDCICSHKHTLFAQDIVTSNWFYCIIQRQSNNILIYFYLKLLWNCNFNHFIFKNLCNLARHKCKTLCGWHRNVEPCRSMHYIKRYCCDIYICALVGWNKNNITTCYNVWRTTCYILRHALQERLVMHLCLLKSLRVSETRKLIYGESILVIPCELLARLRTYWTFQKVHND